MLEIDNHIRWVLGIDVRTTCGPRGILEHTVTRSEDPDFVQPVGWSIESEALTESIHFEFRFDAEARPLLNFYVSRLRDLEREWKSLIDGLREKGMAVAVVINGDVETEFQSMPSVEVRALRVTGRSSMYSESGEQLSEAELIGLLCNFMAFSLLPLIPDESSHSANESQETGLPEGALARVEVNKYERSQRNRAACISHYGSVCLACGFDFGISYGASAAGFIHVHHTVPVSQLGANYRVDPIRDLVPLCPNCHAAAHLRTPPYSVEELRQILAGANSAKPKL